MGRNGPSCWACNETFQLLVYYGELEYRIITTTSTNTTYTEPKRVGLYLRLRPSYKEHVNLNMEHGDIGQNQGFENFPSPSLLPLFNVNLTHTKGGIAVSLSASDTQAQ